MDIFKGTCQEFGKVFSEDLASLDAVDDKVQHHAEALTNCLKLVQSSPDSPSVQRLWTWLIRSAVNILLFIDQPPSPQSLQLFVETIRPWLIDGEFSGLCHKELRDMCSLATKGPWAHPVLQQLISGADVDLKEVREVFDEGLECIEYRIRSLHLSAKINQLILFGTAALTHPKVQKNNAVQKVYQSCAYHVLSEVDLIKQIQYFDLNVTITLIDELMTENINCQKLCNAAIKYLWQYKIMDRLEEVTERWVTLLHKHYPGGELFDYLTKNVIEGETPIQSVQQCVALASALWRVVPDTSRLMCVEILCHSLHLLCSDDANSDQLRNGILSSIAYFLPNSQVARSCALTIFIQNPSIEHYFKVAKTYKVPYDREKDIAANFKAHLRLSLLEYLQQQWPEQFLQSNTWDWPRLQTLCYDTMSDDDVRYVQQVEREEEQKKTEPCAEDAEKNFSEPKLPPISLLEPMQSSLQSLDASLPSVDESDAEFSEQMKSTGDSCEVGDSCDCVACQLKLKEKGVTPNSAATPRPKEPSAHAVVMAASAEADRSLVTDEATVTCPEESCQVVYSKAGMSRHLSRTHHWSLPEIHFFYLSLEKEGLLPAAKSCKNDLATPKGDERFHDTRSDSKRKDASLPSDVTTDAPRIISPSHLDHSNQSVVSEPDPSRNEPPASGVSPGLTPISSRILPTEPAAAKVPAVKQKERQNFQIKCPVSSCPRVFRHRHTIKAHIEFRHNIKPMKAAKMAKDAPYVDQTISSSSTTGTSDNEQTGISRSRGWYWLVDDFIDEDVNSEGDSRSFNRKSDANLRSSVARDIICTLGNAPLSYDLAAAESYIVTNWRFADKHLQATKATEERSPPVADLIQSSTPPGETSFDGDVLPASPEFEFNHMEEEMQPAPLDPSPSPSPLPPVVRNLSDVKSLLHVKVKLKSSKFLSHNETPAHGRVVTKHQSEDGNVSAAHTKPPSTAAHTRSGSCQTKFKSNYLHFSEVDHYHNLSNVKNKKLRKSKDKDKCPIAVKVLSGSILGKPVCSQSSQCCFCEGKLQARESACTTKGKRTEPVKKKSKSLDAPPPTLPLFSSDSEETVTFTTKAVKRKYDAQSVYNIADKCREVQIEAKIRGEPSSGGGSGSKPSFEDALNYAPIVAQTPDKSKATRKRSLSRNKMEEQHTDRQRAATPQEPGPTDDVASNQGSKPKAKKRKVIRPRLSSTPAVKKGKHADVTLVERREESDPKQLAPCQDYEDLLKKAEELCSTISKPKASKPHVPSKTDLKADVGKASKSPGIPKKTPSIEEKSDTSSPSVGEPLAPSRLSPERVKKKKSHRNSKGKRLIALRNLSSTNVIQRSESTSPVVELSAETTAPFDGSMSAPSEQDSVCFASLEEAPIVESSVDLELRLSASPQPPSSVSADILCPECLKPMSSAFALTCHMRKRHKGHSKKMFFPGHTADTAVDPAESHKSKKKHKASKNERESPERFEADSEIAASRLAPNHQNASLTSVDSCSNDSSFLETKNYDSSSTMDRETSTEEEACVKKNILLSWSMPMFNVNLPCNEPSTSSSTSNSFVVPATTCSRPEKSEDLTNSTPQLRASSPGVQSPVGDCKETISSQSPPNDSPASPRTSMPSSEDPSTEAAVGKPPTIPFLNGKFCCPAFECKGKYLHRRSLMTHIKGKHPPLHSQLQSASVKHPQKSSRLTNVPKRATTGQTRKDGDACADKTTANGNNNAPALRRVAYTEANLHIHFSSANSSNRKWDERQELAHLYNKRMRRKIAQSLSPANKKVKPFKSKWQRKRFRAESSDSTDSFEADYEAQLPCWSCDATFHRRKNLVKHVQHHLRHIDLCAFRCDHRGCLFGFRTANELEVHKQKHKPLNQICLFCPNQSRSFKTLKKMIIHEHIAHPQLQINMATLRRTMCLTLPKWSLIYSEEYIVKEINAKKQLGMVNEEADEDVDGSEEEEEDENVVKDQSFLPIGHRRPAKPDRECDECDQSGPSVAKICRCDRFVSKHVVSLVHDLVGAVEDYLWLHRKDAPVNKSHDAPRETSEGLFSVDLKLLADGNSASDAVQLHRGEESGKDGVLPACEKVVVTTRDGPLPIEKETSEVAMEVQEELIDETEAFELSENTKSVAEEQDFKNATLHEGATESTALSLRNTTVNATEDTTPPQDNSQAFQVVPYYSPGSEMYSSPSYSLSRVTHSESTEVCPSLEHDSANIALGNHAEESTSQVDPQTPFSDLCFLDVCQTLHKIICDVEIGEQADYMRFCGYVPTGVMYFKQCDLVNDPGVGLSVFGYNRHAFLSMEQGLHQVMPQTNIPGDSHAPLQAIMATSQNLIDETDTDSNVASTSNAQEQANRTHFPSPCSSLDNRVIKVDGEAGHENNQLVLGPTSASTRFIGAPSTSSVLPIQAAVPTEGPVGFADPDLNRALIQSHFLRLYSVNFHPTWALDADESNSELCDISQMTPDYKKLFCQHFVVPNPALNLPPAPLRGICSSYPIASDYAHSTAFNTWYDDTYAAPSYEGGVCYDENLLPLIEPRQDLAQQHSEGHSEEHHPQEEENEASREMKEENEAPGEIKEENEAPGEMKEENEAPGEVKEENEALREMEEENEAPSRDHSDTSTISEAMNQSCDLVTIPESTNEISLSATSGTLPSSSSSEDNETESETTTCPTKEEEFSNDSLRPTQVSSNSSQGNNDNVTNEVGGTTNDASLLCNNELATVEKADEADDDLPSKENSGDSSLPESQTEEGKPSEPCTDDNVKENPSDAIVCTIGPNESSSVLNKHDDLENLAVHHFMEDFKAGLKERKSSQNAVLKPTNVFKTPGRFQLSFDVEHKFVKKRRNLSEIVAFCDGLTQSDVDAMRLKNRRRIKAYEKRVEKLRLMRGGKAPKKTKPTKKLVEPNLPKKRDRPERQKGNNRGSGELSHSPSDGGSTVCGDVKSELPKNKQLIPMVERLQTSVPLGKLRNSKKLVKSKLKKTNQLHFKKKPSGKTDKNRIKISAIANHKKTLSKTKQALKKSVVSISSNVPSPRPRDLPKRSCLHHFSVDNEQLDEDPEVSDEEALISDGEEYIPDPAEARSCPLSDEEGGQRSAISGDSPHSGAVAKTSVLFQQRDSFFGLSDYYKKLISNHSQHSVAARKTLDLLEELTKLAKPSEPSKARTFKLKRKKKAPNSSRAKPNLTPANKSIVSSTTGMSSCSTGSMTTRSPRGVDYKDICPVCQVSFHQRERFMQHVNAFHVKTKLPFRCTSLGILPFYLPSASSCLFSFNTKKELCQHQTKHKSQRPVPCLFCPSWFPSIRECRLHISSAHDQLILKTSDGTTQSTVGAVNKTTESYQSSFEKFIERHKAQTVLASLTVSIRRKSPGASCPRSASTTAPLTDAQESQQQVSQPMLVSSSANSTSSLQHATHSGAAETEESNQILAVPVSSQSNVTPTTVVERPESFVVGTTRLPTQSSAVDVSSNRLEAESTSNPFTLTSQSCSSDDATAPQDSETDGDDACAHSSHDSTVCEITDCNVATVESEGTPQNASYNSRSDSKPVAISSTLLNPASSSNRVVSVILPASRQATCTGLPPFCSTAAHSCASSAGLISIHKVAITKSYAVVSPTFRTTTTRRKSIEIDVRNLARIAGQTKAISGLVSPSGSHRHASVSVTSTSGNVLSTVLPLLPTHDASSSVCTTALTHPPISSKCSVSPSSLPRPQQTATVVLNRAFSVGVLDAAEPTVSAVHPVITKLPDKREFSGSNVSRLAIKLPTADPTFVTPKPTAAPINHRPATLVVRGPTRKLLIKPPTAPPMGTIADFTAAKKTVLRPPIFVNVQRPSMSSVSAPPSGSTNFSSASKRTASIEINVQVPPFSFPSASASRSQANGDERNSFLVKFPCSNASEIPSSLFRNRIPSIAESSIVTGKPVSRSLNRFSPTDLPRCIVASKQQHSAKRHLSPAADARNETAKFRPSLKGSVVGKHVHDALPLSQKEEKKLFIDLDNLNSSNFTVLECDYCSNMYSNFYDYQSHMLRDHSLFLCGYAKCNVVYGNESSLLKHYEKEHGQTKRCDVTTVLESDDVSMTDSDDVTEYPESDPDPQSQALAASVWDRTIPKVPPQERSQLFTRRKELPADKVLLLLFLEVQAFAAKSKLHKMSSDEKWLRCPIENTPVVGDRKTLYYHILEHRLSEIIEWLQRKFEKNQRAKKMQKEGMGDHETRKKQCENFHVYHDDSYHEQSYDQEEGLHEERFNSVNDKDGSDVVMMADAEDELYRCRFRDCNKKVRGQCNFRGHMFDHSDSSRSAWHEQDGEVWPLFRGIVPLPRCPIPSIVGAEINDTCEPPTTHPRKPSTPAASLPSPKQSLTVTVRDVMRRPMQDLEANTRLAVMASPLAPIGSPISPRVILKKLTSTE